MLSSWYGVTCKNIKSKRIAVFCCIIEHILGNHISKTYMVPKNSIGSKKIGGNYSVKAVLFA